VSDMLFGDVLEAAARATINARCARAYMHDVRGTMQAVYSGFELLWRSAKSPGDNLPRIERAGDMAKRAISNHEKFMVEVMQQLTFQHTSRTVLDLGALVAEVTLFLRNDAANKEIDFAFTHDANITIAVERERLHLLILGLLTAAIDELPAGSVLCMHLAQVANQARLTIGADFSDCGKRMSDEAERQPAGSLTARDLAVMFARQFLLANGGRLEFDDSDARSDARDGQLQIYYPLASPHG
jgi:hypothetical protein